MTKVIAERELLFSLKGKQEKKELIIRIKEPAVDAKGRPKCSVQWDGLYENHTDICGMDSLQALHLATDIDSLLKKLTNKYDFYWSTGEPYFEEFDKLT